LAKFSPFFEDRDQLVMVLKLKRNASHVEIAVGVGHHGLNRLRDLLLEHLMQISQL